MVRKNVSKTKILSSLVVVCLLSAVAFSPLASWHDASAACTTSSGTTTCEESTTFNVRIDDVLTVAITRPDTWANGAINTLLTNKVGVSVTSNNPVGFVATMKSASTTPNLVNQANSAFYIQTLTDSSVTIDDASDSGNDFPAGSWGYGLANNGSAPLTYYPMVGSGGTPITILSSKSANSAVTQDVYFATKADNSIISGTYANSVVISVVSGVIANDNPITPTTPITPADDPTPNDGNTVETNHGNSPTGTSVVAVTTTTNTSVTPNTTTTTTESYAKPQGVTEKTATFAVVNEGTPLATGLAVTAGISAAAGVVFFILAKRRNRDEYDDDGTEDY